MKVITVLSMFVVLICSIWISFVRFIELFKLGGFSRQLAIAAVATIEFVFFMCALSMFISMLKGKRPKIPAVIGFKLCVLLALLANIHIGWTYGLTGIAFGASIAVILILTGIMLKQSLQQLKSLKE